MAPPSRTGECELLNLCSRSVVSLSDRLPLMFQSFLPEPLLPAGSLQLRPQSSSVLPVSRTRTRTRAGLPAADGLPVRHTVPGKRRCTQSLNEMSPLDTGLMWTFSRWILWKVRVYNVSWAQRTTGDRWRSSGRFRAPSKGTEPVDPTTRSMCIILES